jgi:hypothetical protein
MVYQLEGDAFLFEIDRSKIIDISPGDTISIKGFKDLHYTWTSQDSEFLENNPDDSIFIRVGYDVTGSFKAHGIQLRSVEGVR